MSRQRRALKVEVSGPTPPLGIEFEETGTALYIRMSSKPVATTREVEEDVLADYDAEGSLVGFEVIGLKHGRSGTVLGRIKKAFQDQAPSLRLLDALMPA